MRVNEDVSTDDQASDVSEEHSVNAAPPCKRDSEPQNRTQQGAAAVVGNPRLHMLNAEGRGGEETAEGLQLLAAKKPGPYGSSCKLCTRGDAQRPAEQESVRHLQCRLVG